MQNHQQYKSHRHWLWVGIALMASFCLIREAPAQIIVSSNYLDYAANQWAAPGEQSFTVSLPSNSPAHSFWVLSSNSWFSMSPGSGVSQDYERTVTVSFVTANLDPGTYTGDIMVVSPLIGNSPMIIPVTCAVAAAAGQGVRVAPGAVGIMGNSVAIPLHLISTGNVNAAGFSLSYDKTVFSAPAVAVGSNAPDAYLLTNTSLAAKGMIGIAINANNTGDVTSATAAFPAGTQEIAVLSFNVALNRGPGPKSITFTNTPVSWQLADTNSAPITANIVWAGGNVLLTGGLEGDTAPRQVGNTTNTVADWVQVGRFAAGLDTSPKYTPAEFQRADCAPRATFGDGFISVIDWTQAGRYVSGMDPDTIAAGPTNAFPNEQPRGARAAARGAITRIVRIADTAIPRGEANAVDVELVSPRGDENAIGFTLRFDPGIVTYLSAQTGADAGGAFILPNLNHVNEGAIGFAMALPVGGKFARGTNHLLRLNFSAPEDAPTDFAGMTFNNDIIVCEVSSDRAIELDAEFEGMEVPIIGLPRAPAGLSASQGGYLEKILLTWASVPGATLGYQVWRNTSASHEGAVHLATVMANYYNDISVQPGQIYYYAVRALNRTGAGDFSAGIGGWRRFTAYPTRAMWDFDGDGKADTYSYNAATGDWTFWLSSRGYTPQTVHGLGGPGCTPVPGDYDGDGRIDPAVYNIANGDWRVLYSGSGHAERTFNLGGAGYTPVPSDYDGDGKTDFAVYQAGAGLWRIRRSAYAYAEITAVYGDTAHLPAAADFDGDGKADLAIYNAATATLRARLSGEGYAAEYTVGIGQAGMGGVPVPADYDNDGRADPAVYEAATGAWYVRLSGQGYQSVSVNLGGPGYTPLPADYDGDGRIDPAVYFDASLLGRDDQPAHAWMVRLSSQGYAVTEY